MQVYKYIASYTLYLNCIWLAKYVVIASYKVYLARVSYLQLNAAIAKQHVAISYP